MRLAVVDEGKVLVYIPDPAVARAPHGLEPAWLPVFYNPRMEFNRDLSVLALQVYIDGYAPRKPVIAVEPLAATGIRALRYALEVEGILRVYASDIDRMAYDIMGLNVALNNAWGRVQVYNWDANALMYYLKSRNVPVLAVDIDPYGSPAPFMDAAISLVGNGGILMVTATDTAVLEGSRRFKALRRYGVNIVKTPCSREVAIRSLLSYIARVAAGHDKWVKPLLSTYVDYYVRLVIQVFRSSRRAQDMLEGSLGYAYYYPELGYTTMRDEGFKPESKRIKLGPLWVGELQNTEFIEAMIDKLRGSHSYLRTRERLQQLLVTLREEAMVQDDLYQRLDAITSTLKIPTPSKRRVVEELRSRGFKATLTHLHPVAIRTNATIEELINILKTIKP